MIGYHKKNVCIGFKLNHNIHFLVIRHRKKLFNVFFKVFLEFYKFNKCFWKVSGRYIHMPSFMLIIMSFN